MAIEEAKPVPACPKCNRTLVMSVENKINGKVVVALVCSRHGTFPSGWKTKFFDFVKRSKNGNPKA